MNEPQILANLIGGESVAPRGGQYIDNIAPATGRILAKVPRSGADDVAAAVAAAKGSQRAWQRTAPEERAALLEAVGDEIERRAEELAALESRDTGKPVTLARNMDIARAIANFRFFAGLVRYDSAGAHRVADAINYTVKKPVGVAGLITPWNLPLYLLSWKTAPALAMGNAVVAKPSELTPMSASVLGEIILAETRKRGLSAGIFNVVHGTGPEAGEALVSHPDVRAISFTGGTATGAKVAAAAARGVKKLSLELGGKNSTLIFADCDFTAAVLGAVRAAFTNQGQVCLCGSRILVERKLYARFVEAFVMRVKTLAVGDPLAADTQVGALISAGHRDKVEGYLRLAKEEGGTILCGGVRPTLAGPLAEGYFLEPTVIVDLPHTCRTATEEIFGPVVTIHPFDEDEQAVSIANGVRYGLSASVWTRDLRRAHRVSQQLDTGMVWVNTWLMRDLRVPFGGVKDSGVGREGGHHSLEFFSEAQNICIFLGAPT